MDCKKIIKIELKDWDHTCDDGCCYSWGTSITIDGIEIDGGDFSSSNDVMNGLEPVLKHLGYDVIFEYIDNEDI